MKRKIICLACAIISVLFCACGNEQSQKTPANTKVCTANGYTIEIVAVHKTHDSNGQPMAAVELTFQNDNPEPASLMSIGNIKLFQNGIESFSSEMFLERNYDWDSYHREIKDGAKITVFVAEPLINTTDPIEVTVELMDFDSSTHGITAVASASNTFEWAKKDSANSTM